MVELTDNYEEEPGIDFIVGAYEKFYKTEKQP